MKNFILGHKHLIIKQKTKNVDDSFLLFENKDDVKPFFDFANDIHPNIKFTKDEESAERTFFPFLDVKISRFNDRFHTQTYYKPTHTGLYTNWFSFTPQIYKFNLVQCLRSRAWQICSNKELFQEDWLVIKGNLLKNQYPKQLLNAIYRNFVERQEKPQKPAKITVPKKEVPINSAVSRLYLGVPVLVRKIRYADFTNSWGRCERCEPPSGQSPRKIFWV